MSVPSHTELLTQSGWKPLDTLKSNDLVCSFDAAKNEYCWSPLTLSSSSAQVYLFESDKYAVYASLDQKWLGIDASLKSMDLFGASDKILIQANAYVDQLADFAARAKRNERFVQQLQQRKELLRSSISFSLAGTFPVFTMTTPCNNVLIRQEGVYSLIGA